MSIIGIIFTIAVVGIFIYIIKKVREMMLRKWELDKNRNQLKEEGYKFQEEFSSDEWGVKIGYDMDKKILFYLAPDQPPLKIPFRKISDCTILLNSEEQTEFRLSTNDTRKNIDKDFDYWLDTQNKNRSHRTTELQIEMSGFNPSSIKIDFVFAAGTEDDDYYELSKKIIRWYKVIRKITESN